MSRIELVGVRAPKEDTPGARGREKPRSHARGTLGRAFRPFDVEAGKITKLVSGKGKGRGERGEGRAEDEVHKEEGEREKEAGRELVPERSGIGTGA